MPKSSLAGDWISLGRPCLCFFARGRFVHRYHLAVFTLVPALSGEIGFIFLLKSKSKASALDELS